MGKDKLYFKSIDDNVCYQLQTHIEDAQDEGLEKVTLIEAIPDNNNPNYVWCTYYENTEEKSLCNKTNCPAYTSESGKGKCEHKGKLYLHGEEVTFDVPKAEL